MNANKFDSPMWADVLEFARVEGTEAASKRFGIGRVSIIQAGQAHGLDLRPTKAETIRAANTRHAERMRLHYDQRLGTQPTTTKENA